MTTQEYYQLDSELAEQLYHLLESIPPPSLQWHLDNPDRWTVTEDGQIIYWK